MVSAVRDTPQEPYASGVSSRPPEPHTCDAVPFWRRSGGAAAARHPHGDPASRPPAASADRRPTRGRSTGGPATRDDHPVTTSYGDRPGGSSPGEPGRDRDGTGRARNARPRDELGRPLPHGTAGVAPLPDDLALSPDDALGEAQRLLDEGRPFQAHEVLEATWKAAPAAERALWQGLAQLAVGVTHARRGNQAGAVTLLTRGRTSIAPYVQDAPYDVDVPGLLSWAELAIARLGQDEDEDDRLEPPMLRRR